MTEAKDYLDFLEQHRLMDDAQKYPLVVEYARSCEAEIARLRAALQEIERGVDHPLGIVGAPAFYEAMEWASTIANAALEGRE